MKAEQTQSKILSQVKDGKLYNKKIVLTVEHLFKQNNSKISKSKIRQTLSDLNKQGKILIKDNKIVPSESFLVGVFKAKKSGAFVILQEGEKNEFFQVASSEFKEIPNNTLVGFIVKSSQEKKVAHIANIISFDENSLFGCVKINKKGQACFVPDLNPYNAKFTLIDSELVKFAIDKKCRVKIKSTSASKDKFFVALENKEDIFGPALSPLANIEAILREEKVPKNFSLKVLNEANTLPTSVTEQDLNGRKDYRKMNFITIDPATAQDMDDAVYLEKFIDKDNLIKYKYYIAIADISHYVKEGSELDKEAKNRAFSIYTAGGVTPMLPPALSNNICSIVQGQDRLAIVTEITFDEKGNMLDYSFYNGVINSKQKMSYDFVQDVYEGKIKLDASQAYLKNMLDEMYELTDKINILNKEKGTLSLSGYQPTVILSEDKNSILDFVNKNFLPSTGLIEKAMIANNIAVANFLKNLSVPILLREHASPLETRFEEFENYMSFLGIDLGNFKTFDKAYANVAELFKGHYLEKIMSMRLIRSMQKAKYTIDSNASHFALAEEDYTHFTAGIRRYIDITVHRTLKKVLVLYNKALQEKIIDNNLPMSKNINKFSQVYKDQLSQLVKKEELEKLVLHLNQKEESANRIEAKTNVVCSALYMKKNIGKTFSAYISAVEKDFVLATLKDEKDSEHSDIIEVVLPLKNLIKNKVLFVDNKTHTVSQCKSSKVIYYEGKKLEVTITDINFVEGKIFAEDNFIQTFEEKIAQKSLTVSRVKQTFEK